MKRFVIVLQPRQRGSMKIKYILSDLDGVIRHYPPHRDQTIERKYGLSEGLIFRTAFRNPLLKEAICGRIPDEVWRSDIEAQLTSAYSKAVAKQAVQEWSSFPGQVDQCYLDCLEQSFPGIPIAVLTNGTSRLPSDLKVLEISNRFYKIFNSSEIGACKPEDEIYIHVLKALGCSPSEILFIDDSHSHVLGAENLGFKTHHYSSLEIFKTELISYKK